MLEFLLGALAAVAVIAIAGAVFIGLCVNADGRHF
jgi:hypothetical protein